MIEVNAITASSCNLLLQTFSYMKQLTTVNGISTSCSNSTWRNMLDLAFEPGRTNGNLVTRNHLAATSKRASPTTVGDCTNCGRRHISSVCCSCTTCT